MQAAFCSDAPLGDPSTLRDSSVRALEDAELEAELRRIRRLKPAERMRMLGIQKPEAFRKMDRSGKMQMPDRAKATHKPGTGIGDRHFVRL